VTTPHWHEETPRQPEDLIREVREELEAQVAAQPWWRRAMHTLGHRGAFLIVVGFMYLALGYVYAVGSTPPEVLAQLAMPIQVMDWVGIDNPHDAVTAWALLWMGCAIVAILTSWWPPGYDFIGFIALWVFACVWSLLNIAGALFLDAPRAEIVGFIFFVHAISVLIVSAMVDPTAVSRIADREA
jgi:hypothetical protein